MGVNLVGGSEVYMNEILKAEGLCQNIGVSGKESIWDIDYYAHDKNEFVRRGISRGFY